MLFTKMQYCVMKLAQHKEYVMRIVDTDGLVG